MKQNSIKINFYSYFGASHIYLSKIENRFIRSNVAVGEKEDFFDSCFSFGSKDNY